MDAGPPSGARWVLDRIEEDLGKAWLLPDFGLFSWPEPWVGSWHNFRCLVQQYEAKTSWEEKKSKLVSFDLLEANVFIYR